MINSVQCYVIVVPVTTVLFFHYVNHSVFLMEYICMYFICAYFIFERRDRAKGSARKKRKKKPDIVAHILIPAWEPEAGRV